MSVDQLPGIRKDYTNAARLGQKKSKAAAKAASAAKAESHESHNAETEAAAAPVKPTVSVIREIKDKVTEIKSQVNEFEFENRCYVITIYIFMKKLTFAVMDADVKVQGQVKRGRITR